jgi:hypothetical protein
MTDRVYPLATLPFQNPSWEGVTASRVKGETERQLQHAKDVMTQKEDTSIDAPWWVHRHWSVPDVYTIAIMALFWTPLMFLLWPFFFLFSLPPVGLNLLYISTRVPKVCEVIPRDTIEWKMHCLVQFILSLPVQVLAIFTLMYSHVVMTIFGGIFLLSSSLCTRRSATDRFFENLEVIAPHSGGPNLYWHFGDCVAAVAGSVHRQGLLEFTVSFANMFLFNPWIKYWVTGNLYLEDLSERFITQIGEPLKIGIHEIDTNTIKAISNAKHTEDNRKEIDANSFAPHYPYPPEGRRYAVGMQFAGLITTFVHTTHFRSPEIGEEGPIASLSSSCALPIYRVMLWRNNPYHIFTGYVEANVSTGWPSQKKKETGLEHPMWMVNTHNKLAADRKICFSVGWIDTFFDEFIPHLNHFIRLNALGKEAADAALAADPKKGYESSHATQYQRMSEI